MPAPDYTPNAEHEQSTHLSAPLCLDEGPSSPQYAPTAHADEWSLGAFVRVSSADDGDGFPRCAPGTLSPLTQPMGVNDSLLWDTKYAHCHSESESILSVSLGKRLWGLRHPAYGTQGEVADIVRLSKHLTHVTNVTVSLIGRVTITEPHTNEFIVVKESALLVSPDNASTLFPPGACFTFNLRFPAEIAAPAGGRVPLPPTYLDWSPGMSCDVSYYLKIDAVRKGLRAHEEHKVPVPYFPKSWPMHAPPGALAAADTSTLKTIMLRHMWPAGAHLALTAPADPPLVLVSLPSEVSIAAGDTLLVRVTIRAPAVPALAGLLARGVSVQLTRQTKIHVSGEVRLMRDVVFRTGALLDVDTTHKGTAEVQLTLPVGDAGSEQSWSAPGMLEVLYHLRVNVQAPADSDAVLPIYVHEEHVHVATESHGTRQRELLSLGGVSALALGILNRHTSYNSFVTW